METPIEPDVNTSWLDDEGLIFVHQNRMAIVMTRSQARRLIENLNRAVAEGPK